jgi:hypothetical protein
MMVASATHPHSNSISSTPYANLDASLTSTPLYDHAEHSAVEFKELESQETPKDSQDLLLQHFNDDLPSLHAEHRKGKGRVVFSQSSFQKGDVIFSEVPLFVSYSEEVDKDMIEKLEKCLSQNEDQSQLVRSLCSNLVKWKERTSFPRSVQTLIDERNEMELTEEWESFHLACAIYNMNSFALENVQNSTEARCLFLKMSLLNHSCFSNCKVGDIKPNGSVDLIALKEIGPGDELTINYNGASCSVENHDELEHNYFLDFKCPKQDPMAMIQKASSLTENELIYLHDCGYPDDKMHSTLIKLRKIRVLLGLADSSIAKEKLFQVLGFDKFCKLLCAHRPPKSQI